MSVTDLQRQVLSDAGVEACQKSRSSRAFNAVGGEARQDPDRLLEIVIRASNRGIHFQGAKSDMPIVRPQHPSMPHGAGHPQGKVLPGNDIAATAQQSGAAQAGMAAE